MNSIDMEPGVAFQSALMSTQRVSVVVPSFNRAHCIERAIRSVLDQGHTDVEVLVADDGSTDDTRSVLERLFASDPRVVYLYQENKGVSAARNLALSRATGDFVAFLDSDDIWLPSKLELQLACLRHFPDAGMVWSDMSAVRPDGTVTHERYLRTMYSGYRWFEKNDLFDASVALTDLVPAAGGVADLRAYSGDISSPMLMGNLVHTSTVLLRRERFDLIRRFDERLGRSGEDYEFHLRTCRAGRVAYIDAPLVLYQRGADDQLTGERYDLLRAENFLMTIAPIIRSERSSIRLPGWMLDEVMAEAHAWVGETELRFGKRWSGVRHLVQSLRFKPGQPRVAGLIGLSALPQGAAERSRAAYRRAKRALESWSGAKS